MRHHPRTAGVTFGAVALVAVLGASCDTVPDGNDPAFPKDYHSPFPLTEGQVATGEISDTALDQPIPFTHHRHVTVLGIDCQYCHSDARRSIHGGVPPLEVCMGCHTYVFKDKPAIKTLTGYWDRKEPVPWQKVHDLPDYVQFEHKRHVRAGVDCTECHGQVGLQGDWATDTDYTAVPVMKREASLQMGWCLDCHASHPSIDQNYGDQADLRRAELKDCWTCHK